MAALTKAGQGSNPSSMPSSPWERGHGRGHNCSNTPTAQTPTMVEVGPGQTTPACSLPTGHGTGGSGTGSNGQSNQGNGTRREGTPYRWDPNSLQCFRCQGWGHMGRECPTSASALNQPWGNWGIQLTPCQQKPPQPAVGPMHSHPNFRQKTSLYEGSLINGPERNHPSYPIPESRSWCLPGWMIQWGPCNCGWAKGDCINWLRCPRFQYQL